MKCAVSGVFIEFAEDKQIRQFLPAVSGENDNIFHPSSTFASTAEVYKLSIEMVKTTALKMCTKMAGKMLELVTKDGDLPSKEELVTQPISDMFVSSIMSRDKFEELVGLKGVEIMRNRDLIKWCRQTLQTYIYHQESLPC